MPLSYDDVLTIFQTDIIPREESEVLPLLSALNRIAIEPIYASFELPQSAISLRDGYAFRLKDGPAIPLSLCTHVSTGDALAESIDAVIANEEALMHEKHLLIPEGISKGWHIKKKGEDISQEECLVHAFESLSAYKLTALAAQGINKVRVLKKPRVAILSIGSTLSALGEPLMEGNLYNSNAISLSARVMDLGCEVCTIQTLGDDEVLILQTLRELHHFTDLVITTGALSYGDSIASLLSKGALEILFNEVAITPAKPSALSRIHNTPILHLPGLPLGSLLGFELLGVPLIRALMHHSTLLPQSYHHRNGTHFTCKPCCVSAIPGFSDGKTFTCAPHYEAGRLNILAKCNGYVRIERKEEVLKGEAVTFIPFT
jgi:molybdopterin molybdotransferase